MTLYGMAVGGKGYVQSIVDHPELYALPEGQWARKIYGIAIKEIITNPWRFIFYYFDQCIKFLHLFAKYELGMSRILVLIAGVWVIIKWREPVAGLCIALFFGILFSAPFLMEDAGVRPFASVFPMLAVVPALALGLIVHAASRKTFGETIANQKGRSTVPMDVSIGVLSLIILIGGPIYAVTMNRTAVWDGLGCKAGEIGLKLNGNSSASVRVVQDQFEGQLRTPIIRFTDFIRIFPTSLGIDIRSTLENMKPPFTFVAAYIPGKGRTYFVLTGLAPGDDVFTCLPDRQKNGKIKIGYVYDVRKGGN